MKLYFRVARNIIIGAGAFWISDDAFYLMSVKSTLYNFIGGVILILLAVACYEGVTQSFSKTTKQENKDGNKSN